VTAKAAFLSAPAKREVVALSKRLAVVEAPRREWNLGKAAPPPAPTAPEPVVAYHPDPEGALWEAFANAEKEGLRCGQERVESLIERYLDGIRRLEEVSSQGTAPMAAEIVELAMVIAKEIVGRELTLDRDILVDSLCLTLDTMRNEAPITVRLGRADATYVRKRRPDLAEAGIVIVEDENLGVGGCIVESSRRILDASVESRLEAVRQAVKGALGQDAGQAEGEGQ
jgi:flagellar assembly protein FliH